MSLSRLTAWLACRAALLATAGALALTACGGGSGAPNNPYTPGPAIPGPLTVVPLEGVAFAGTPLILSISGGTPPYQAFSSNPAALPVTQAVTGNTLALLANNVSATQAANVTIRDSGGQTALSEIVVRPAVLLPASLTIVPNAAPCDGGDVCSGQTSVASVRVTGPTGGGMPGQSVRFDVVQGAFSLQTTNPGSPLEQTQTVVSDANGDARVVIAVAPNTPTQIGLLRATELSTGSQVTAQFIIAQVTSGEGVLSVAPSGSTTITGPAQNICSSGVRVSYYVFGGTPPYRVVVNFPDAVALVGSPVLVNGGGFDAITNGTCFTNLSFAITDATGRTITSGLPTITNSPGAQTTTPPPTATPLQVSPTNVGSATSRLNCSSTSTVQFVITGKPPFSAATAQMLSFGNSNPVTVSPGTLFVSGLTNGPPGTPNTFSITIGDGSTPQQFQTVQIFCQ